MTRKTEILKDIVREPYAWPGGYEKFSVTTDGGTICAACCKSEYCGMLHSTRGNYRDGWDVDGVIAVGATCEEATCDHCGRQSIM